MLNVFIETSGKAHPNDKGPFVATAILIQEQNVEKLKFGIQELKLLTLGTQGRNVRIKANDIVHGNGIFANFSIEQRSVLLDRLMKILEDSDAEIAYSVIGNKKASRGKPIEITMQNEELALRELILRIYLASSHFSDSEFSVIVDSQQWDHDAHLADGTRKLIFDLFKESEHLGLRDTYKIGTPVFLKPNKEPFIEIANLVAYVIRNKYYRIKRDYNYSFTHYFGLIQKKLYRGFNGENPTAGIFEL